MRNKANVLEPAGTEKTLVAEGKSVTSFEKEFVDISFMILSECGSVFTCDCTIFKMMKKSEETKLKFHLEKM